MLCYRCGSVLPDGSDTCPHCGYRLKKSSDGSSSRSTKQRFGRVPPKKEAFHEKGEKIAGRYEVVDVIGGGGLGYVYRVRDLEIDVEVALKYFDPSLFADKDSLNRFGKSLRAIRRFSQPNIVRIYDVEQIGRSYYVTMQLLEGLSLRQIIDLRKNKGQLFGLEEIEPIVSQVSLALQHAHQYTYHGNLKPENIIVLPDLLKVTDFCLDRAVPHEAYLNAQVETGTIEYLAPERRQVKARGDRRADIYSLGVIIGEMLAGKVFKGIPFRISKFNEKVPKAMDYVYLRSVHPAAAVRYPAIEDLAEDILEILEKGDLSYSYSLDDLKLATTRPKTTPPPFPAAKSPGKEAVKPVSDTGEGQDQKQKESRLVVPKKAGQAEKTRERREEPSEKSEEENRPEPVLADIDDTAWEEVIPDLDEGGAKTAEETEAEAEDKGEALVVEEDLVISEEEIEPVGGKRPGPESAGDEGSSPEAMQHMQDGREVPAEEPEQREQAPVIGDSQGDEEFSIDIDMEEEEEEEEEPAAAEPPAEDERHAGVRSADTLGGEETVARLVGEEDSSSPFEAEEFGKATPPETSDSDFGDKERAKPPEIEKGAQTTGDDKKPKLKLGLWVVAIVFGALIGAGLFYVFSGTQGRPVRIESASGKYKKDAAAGHGQKKEKADARKEAVTERRASEKEATKQPQVEERAVKEEAKKEQQVVEKEEKPANSVQKTSTVSNQSRSTSKKRLSAKKRKQKAREAIAQERLRKRREQEERARKEKEERLAMQRKRAEERARQEQEERRRRRQEEEKAAMAVPPPSGTGLKCPRGMILIPAGPFLMGSSPGDPMRNFGEKANVKIQLPAYCIDYYEYPNGRGLMPRVNVNWYTAKKLCERRGKRLCTEEEWEKACKGPNNRKYPYGNRFNPNMCNTEDANGEDRELSPSGTFRKCRSGYGVFDMSGNASEWTAGQWSSTIRDRVQKGGSADRPDWAVRCASRENHSPSSKGSLAGFRCCADPLGGD